MVHYVSALNSHLQRRIGQVTRTYRSGDTKTAADPTFEMQCVDCHNRPGHSFQVPARGIDVALETGRIDASLPFVKKVGVGLISAVYRSAQEAAQKIPSGLADYYRQQYPDLADQRAHAIQVAGAALLEIYDHNVFPDLKVTWETYANNLGHADYPGCFRCHDGNHIAANNETIPQDCGVCHQLLAVQEKSPDVLKTLGLADMLTSVRQ